MIDISDPDVVQTEAVKNNGYALQYVIHQTEEMCIEAVRENGCALKYVHNQTEAICICAVKQNGNALKYVINQTEAICMEAVREYGLALRSVHNQTEAICIESVKTNPYTLRYVHNQTETICLKAIEICFNKLHYCTFGKIYDTIKYPSPQLITELLKLYPSLADTIMSTYAIDIMTTHKVCSDAICVYIVQHADDLLYRPNSVNALVRHSMWYRTINNAKTVFLML